MHGMFFHPVDSLSGRAVYVVVARSPYVYVHGLVEQMPKNHPKEVGPNQAAYYVPANPQTLSVRQIL